MQRPAAIEACRVPTVDSVVGPLGLLARPIACEACEGSDRLQCCLIARAKRFAESDSGLQMHGTVRPRKTVRPCLALWDYGRLGGETPADFCCTITGLATCSVPIPETYDRSPEVSLTASRAQPPDLRSVSLMDRDFAVSCQLVRLGRTTKTARKSHLFPAV